MKTVEGRNAVTRKEIAKLIGYTEAGARALYGKRGENGHPEPAFSLGRTIYWWQDEVAEWWAHHQEATRPEPIERVGNPNELLTAQQAADLLGYSNPRTILAMVARGQSFPAPDAHLSGAGQKSGQDRPQWKRRTIWDYADGRSAVRK